MAGCRGRADARCERRHDRHRASALPERQTHPAWADALADLEPREHDDRPARSPGGSRARLRPTSSHAAASPDAPRPAPYPVQRGLTPAMKDAGRRPTTIIGCRWRVSRRR